MLINYFIFWIFSTWIQTNQEQIELMETIPFTGNFFEIDQLGNFYLINSNTLVQYSPNLVKKQQYTNNFSGKVTHIDVNDPLRILLFYKDFNQVVFLDRALSLLGSPVDLDQLGFTNVALVCSSNSGGFWLFNNDTGQLVYLNKDLQVIYQSPDIRLLADGEISPSHMIERNQKVYLNLSHKGIFIFNQYGGFEVKLPVFSDYEIGVTGSTLQFIKEGSVNLYQLKTHQQNIIPLPKHLEIKDLEIYQNKIFIFSDNKLFIYKIIN